MLTDVTHKKYTAYSLEDLLQDDYFISSVINPTKESDAFWAEEIQKGTIAMNDYSLARYFIDSVQVKKERISQEEIHHLWEDIEIANKHNLVKKKRRATFYFSAMTGIAATFALLFIWSNLLEKKSFDKINVSNI
jgi:hypothetical protein